MYIYDVYIYVRRRMFVRAFMCAYEEISRSNKTNTSLFCLDKGESNLIRSANNFNILQKGNAFEFSDALTTSEARVFCRSRGVYRFYNFELRLSFRSALFFHQTYKSYSPKRFSVHVHDRVFSIAMSSKRRR